ncbi:MAG: SDR family oxidoreductase [Betaproteobacteria bacterium]|jgi:NAD(P)-dependent dehydrogenase (short-subunit alcohol dehydrogenase family)|nr:SDR family oxidoreductase [Pseudomonadota bacterium]NBO02899.1 SDR family oxidoreductase [Betaproteobacteria bacterium]NBP34791.1 SDR family oxidoreductase [Betaproteobacteria bacterium]NBQ77698.1 SDR family oxidoreductase [Betaproteobacteria bacterium]NBQ94307.1 SDR family oxidoreductase [Betaproteobacteria bacterium]
MGQAVFDFSGTTTVITGGASGIGLTCAELIAKCGGDVVVSASRRPDKTEKALDRIRSASGGKSVKVAAFACEVGTEASVASFFEQITKAGIRVDYVIHSAGVSPNTDFFDQTQTEWDTVLNTNTTGAFLVTKHAALAMKQNPVRGDFRGKILLVTSTNGINSQDPVSAHYDSSKAAANMLVRTAAEHLSESQICVNALAPGWINTDLNATLPPDVREKESAKIWMKRWAEPEEMARCAVHLLTMPYLMGQVVMADGGYR